MSLGLVNPPATGIKKQTEPRSVNLELVSTRPIEKNNFSVYFPPRTLFCLNISMAIFHTVLFATTLVVGNLDLKIPLYMTNITFVRNQSSADPPFQLVPSYSEYSYVYLTIITALFFVCSAFAHFGNAFLWKSFYERELSKCRVPTRWIEYFFSASIMIYIIAFNAGMREHLLLWAVTLLIASTMPFGFLTEVYSNPISNDEWNQPLSLRLTFHLLGYIPQMSAWILILLNFYSEKPQNPPAFVFGIIWGQMVLFFSFGFVQLYQILSPPKYYFKGEIAYQWLSLLAKGILGVFLLTNVLVLSSYDEIFN